MFDEVKSLGSDYECGLFYFLSILVCWTNYPEEKK